MADLYDQSKHFAKLFGMGVMEPDWNIVRCIVGPEQAAAMQADWQLRAVEDKAIEFGASFS